MDIEIVVRLKDGPEGRRKGDIIHVRETPFNWPGIYSPPRYGIVSIKNITKEEFKIYEGRHLPKVPDGKGGEYPAVRSKYRFDLDTMPIFLSTKQQVLKTGMNSILTSRQIEDQTIFTGVEENAIGIEENDRPR